MKQVLQTLLEMVRDRGFLVDYVHPSESNEDEETELVPCLKAHLPDHAKCVVAFLIPDKLTIQGIKDRISVMNREGATNAILVYQTAVTSSAKKSIETLEYGFELFSSDELQLNITCHRLVPRHDRVTPQEKQELEASYKGKLPQLLHTDAVARYYAFQKGDYVRITRRDGSVIYRVVR